MPERVPEPNRPHRWDLVRGDQLGSLVEGIDEYELGFVDEITDCAARVLALSGGGDLYFVGRSADSVFDLLSGVLSGTSAQDRLHHLPLSLYGLLGENLRPAETRQLRANLTAAGLAPQDLMRRKHPIVLVDLVHRGSTFTNLYRELRAWIDDERAGWDVIRRKLRFVGITWRTHTSPNTWRWQQHAEWTRDLPAHAVRNVSLRDHVWSYLGNRQPKTTKSFRRERWSDHEATVPRHDDIGRRALIEAVLIVEHGRSPEGRAAFLRCVPRDLTNREPWSRSLIREVRDAAR
ncbi:hypothetical protein J4H86_20610 [Spiractinospora alimapuensis]|uniref:hypothetical protein n=1 Tax=Spiractinospora alimapuensis TaxID=2820884 RepID=UPI001F2C3A94|nr:hypothetical protein [Spiractinospora alimapuensis]QVQ51203.1 hypothetical protein J4H86_20610 [Spiractinospora alimapuensis]